MTPALDLLKKVRYEHRARSYEHYPKAASYGLEPAENFGLDLRKCSRHCWAATEKFELPVAVVPVVWH